MDKPTPPTAPKHPLLSAPMKQRFLAHVTTDKALYKPGETVYGRALLLNAFSRVPYASTFQALLEIRSPKGDVVHSGALFGTGEGVAPFSYALPKEIAGGDYKAVIKFYGQEFAPAERAFEVRAYRPPRLKTELEFVKKAYGPGDTVAATLEVSRAEGGIPAGAPVTAVAVLDGVELYRAELSLNDKGGCEVRFGLPAEIGEGEGNLSMLIRDGGVQESAVKTIPIPRHKLALRFYPEGGRLVAGLSQRLYLEARTAKGKPADVAGRVLSPSGEELGHFRSTHEGRGHASFTFPAAGEGYVAVLDEPAGVTTRYSLPLVEASGASLRVAAEVIEAGKPLVVAVESSPPDALAGARVVVAVREHEVGTAEVAGPTEALSIALPKSASGVLRVTLVLANGLPVAERLVFRRPTASIQVEVEGPSRAGLRDPLTLLIRTKDQDGDPVAALLGVAVVDDAPQKNIERRERPPRLRAQVLLEPEVQELRDAAAYLDRDPEAPAKLDLLLGTQGWRRFAFRDVSAFLAAHGDAAERVLGGRRVPQPQPPMMAMAFGAPGGPVPAPAPVGRARGGPVDVRAEANWLPLEEGGAPLLGDVLLEMPDEDEVTGAGQEEVLAFAEDLPAMAAMPAAPAPVVPAPVPAMPMPAPVMPAPMPGAPMPAAKIAMPAPEAPAPMAEAAEAPPPGLFRRIGQALGLLKEPAGGVRPMPMPPPPPPMPPFVPGPPPAAGVVVVREYAHKAAGAFTGARSDFAETLYWNALVQTDAKGEARVSFDLCDSITSFEARVDAVSQEGALGEGVHLIEARRPFYLEPKLPLEVTAGDQLVIPVAAVNGTSQAVEVSLSVMVEGPLSTAGVLPALSLPAEGRARALVSLGVSAGMGAGKLSLLASAGPLRDDVTRAVEVVPRGFPQVQAHSGRLEGQVSHTVSLPASTQPGSLVIEALLYPSPAASLEKAVAALLREPCGCFEQTSSTAYPNAMALQYLTSHSGADPALIKRSKELLEQGYRRLLSFECPAKGYEWFGGDPGHEALSAYGLLEFTEMAAVAEVDLGMIERTRAWLLSRRDGEGGFKRNARALDTFGGAPAAITDAYITWALAQTKQPGLAAEIARTKESAASSRDPYLLALAANILLEVQDPAAGEVCRRLAESQRPDGSLSGTSTSITGSTGLNLTIETTALSILAFLRAPSLVEAAERAMRWLLERCKGGSFGATQATILALKAIIAYDAQRSAARAAGVVRLLLNGEVAGETSFTADQQGALALVRPHHAAPGQALTLSLVMEGGYAMPYSLRASYFVEVPEGAEGCPVVLSVALAKDEVPEGETVDLALTLSNTSEAGQAMTVAIVGLPGGLEARADQLRELVKEGKIDFFELRGREIILYYRGMAPREEKRLVLSLLAAVPGRYTGPASRAYLYYSDDQKCWVAPLSASIQSF